jgi:hypothetical protein
MLAAMPEQLTVEHSDLRVQALVDRQQRCHRQRGWRLSAMLADGRARFQV